VARDIGADECFDRIRRSSAVTAAATIGCHTNGSRSLYGFSTGLPVAAVFALISSTAIYRLACSR